MRLVLDECVDEDLRHRFAEHDCRSARYAGLAGLKNGKLLAEAEAAGFDVLITVDQSIPEQQNWRDRRLALLILVGRTNRLADLDKLVPLALIALRTIQPGEVIRVR